GAPPAPVVESGTFGVTFGVTGILGSGIAGLIVVGAPIFGIVATVVTAGVALEEPLLSAAYAAPVAPATSTASAVRTTAPERQVGACEARLSGAPAPQFRHQSWPSASGLPQLAHVRAGGLRPSADRRAPPSDPAGGCCSAGAAGGSASAVDTVQF